MKLFSFTKNTTFSCTCISVLSSLVLLVFVISSVSATTTPEDSGFCTAQEQEQEQSLDCVNNKEVLEMASAGGLSESSQNSVEIDGLARFALDEHNKKENVLLELGRVVKAKEQVVAGTMHHLTLEVIEAGKKKLYEAKIWVKPWMNFKELQEFRHVGDADDAPSFTSSDLGVKQDAQESGWRSVPVHDPIVKDAADRAVTTIQQRSNSLFPYVLQEIVHAKAEVIEESSKLEMLLKVKRGEKEENLKVEVHKKDDGSFQLKQMESVPS